MPLAAVVALGAITPSYVRAYRVAGPSDAPSFLIGDRILVNKAAYDVRLPYTGVVVVSHSRPRRGDVVLFRSPGEDHVVFKRVIGCPGDTVLVRGGRVSIDGVTLGYERVDATEYRTIDPRNHLGAVVEWESGNGPPHLITHTPDAGPGTSLGPIRVGDDAYFVIGDNRDNSRDSRDYGAIPRGSIVGKVVRSFRKDR